MNSIWLAQHTVSHFVRSTTLLSSPATCCHTWDTYRLQTRKTPQEMQFCKCSHPSIHSSQFVQLLSDICCPLLKKYISHNWTVSNNVMPDWCDCIQTSGFWVMLNITNIKRHDWIRHKLSPTAGRHLPCRNRYTPQKVLLPLFCVCRLKKMVTCQKRW